MSGLPGGPLDIPGAGAGEHRARACAKVNLGLAVTGRRADGYHELRSVFLRLTLHDDVAARAHGSLAAHTDRPPRADRPPRGDRLVVRGDPDCSVKDNLVLRAAALLRASAGRPLPPLRLRLTKRIPVAAGLGGGSSDAAAALAVAARAWGLDPGNGPTPEAVLRLGADVPFFAAGHAAAAVAGIGEQLSPLPAPAPPAGVLLVTPPARLATAAVFARLDASTPTPGTSAPDDDRARMAGASAEAVAALADRLRAGLDGAGLASAAAFLRDANDLWAPAAALAPGLADLRAALESELGVPVLLTGSGTTLLAVYPSGARAAAAAGHLALGRFAWLDRALVHATTTTQEGQGS